MSRRRSRRHRAVATTIVGAFLLGACAADPDDTRPPDVTFETVPPATTTLVPTTTLGTASTSSLPDASTTVPTVAPTTLAPSRDTVDLEEVATGLTAPVDLAIRSGVDDLYIAQQGGQVLALTADGERTTVLDVSDEISTGGERGLLGIAFTPDGSELIVSVTDRDGNTLVSGYRLAADGTADPASQRTLFTAAQPYPNHNGGDVAFGPDGMLYIGLGDGGAGGDPERHALDVSSPLGKILRIDISTTPAEAPADNPFVATTGALPEIWAVGLRNPWRFSFDAATGDLWIADVGQNEWEEINVARADTRGRQAGRGLNFGWSALEGTHPFNDDQSAEGATPPVAEYPHGAQGCSVSGGTVVRDGTLLHGWYVFSDYCSGVVRAIDATAAVPGDLSRPVRLGTSSAVTAVCAGPDGSAYVLSVGDGGAGSGTISRLVPG